MKDGSSKKSKSSWPKTLVRKWLNIKSKAEDFHANNFVCRGESEEWMNFSDRETCKIKKSKAERSSRSNSDPAQGSDIDVDSQVTDVQTYRIFVATWNVAGKSPPNNLNLEDSLHISPPADIYVLGFQEIVPLNAGNVLGTEDNGPARKWLSLIQKTLNSLSSLKDSFRCPSPSPHPVVELDTDFEELGRQKALSFLGRSSFHSLSRSTRMTDNNMLIYKPWHNRRFSVYDSSFRWDDSSDDENRPNDSPHITDYATIDHGSFMAEDKDREPGRSKYCLVANKQMVGLFLTVWVKSEHRDDIQSTKVCCVGRGLMGYLGNKGSISISMFVQKTSFCFICSHLTSGQKEGDELRRNSDVMEILRKTRFPSVNERKDENSPHTILEHDRVIWLGDLNYRIALSYRSAKALVEMRNWRVLLENDQLQIEQRMGRVFDGWSEGKIYFPPTYKYSNNSDRYMGDDWHPIAKRRKPAWCDRILWYGRGLHQISYVCGESKFSDHRPVYSVFMAEVDTLNPSEIMRSMSCSNYRMEVKELWPYSYGYNDLNLL